MLSFKKSHDVCSFDTIMYLTKKFSSSTQEIWINANKI